MQRSVFHVQEDKLPKRPPVKTDLRFEDITASTGIHYVHDSSPDAKYIMESMSGGLALIDYDRDALQFEKGRIKKFAITQKDYDRFIKNIIEKPSQNQIEEAKGKNGFVGVSMNIFGFQYDMIYPFLEKVPFNHVRHEKELPDAVKMMIDAHPKCLFAFPLSEHVPDLTSKSDILIVKRYLEKFYAEATF